MNIKYNVLRRMCLTYNLLPCGIDYFVRNNNIIPYMGFEDTECASINFKSFYLSDYYSSDYYLSYAIGTEEASDKIILTNNGLYNFYGSTYDLEGRLLSTEYFKLEWFPNTFIVKDIISLGDEQSNLLLDSDGSPLMELDPDGLVCNIDFHYQIINGQKRLCAARRNAISTQLETYYYDENSQMISILRHVRNRQRMIKSDVIYE